MSVTMKNAVKWTILDKIGGEIVNLSLIHI